MDVVVLVICTMLVIAFALNVFPVYIAKQKLDTFAVEVLREAEISGRVGSETAAAEQRLRGHLGIAPTLSWSKTGNIPLNAEIAVTATLHMDIGLFGTFGSFPVTLRSDAIGKSEVYYK